MKRFDDGREIGTGATNERSNGNEMKTRDEKQ